MRYENTNLANNRSDSGNGFSDEFLAGQRIMAGFDGTELTDYLKYLIAELHIGGIILFSRNIETPHQVRRLCESVQAFANAHHLPPLFIAIDQEGGRVARLKPPFTQFPDPSWIKTPDDARKFGRITATELTSVGINMNMAPVLDVIPENGSSVMATRSMGHDPYLVGRLGAVMIETMQSYGVMAVAKHFPGIGRTELDSHEDLPISHLSPGDLAEKELIPFQNAIQADVSGMMLSHICYAAMDPKWPASLSQRIAHEMLRYEMNFRQLVITDDLDMGAIKKHYALDAGIRQIVLAEIDMALICHQSPDIETAFHHLTGLVNTDMRSRFYPAIVRILEQKERFLNYRC